MEDVIFPFIIAPQFVTQEDRGKMDSDDKWFNNPQIRLTITKTVRTMYISIMQPDSKIANSPYAHCNFYLFTTKVKDLLFIDEI